MRFSIPAAGLPIDPLVPRLFPRSSRMSDNKTQSRWTHANQRKRAPIPITRYQWLSKQKNKNKNLKKKTATRQRLHQVRSTARTSLKIRRSSGIGFAAGHYQSTLAERLGRSERAHSNPVQFINQRATTNSKTPEFNCGNEERKRGARINPRSARKPHRQ